jgi:hypothetical protein
MERMLGWLFALMSATENFQRSRHNDPWSAERKMREQEIAFALLASCLTVGLAFFVTSLVETSEVLQKVATSLRPGAGYLLLVVVCFPLLWLVTAAITYASFLHRSQ